MVGLLPKPDPKCCLPALLTGFPGGPGAGAGAWVFGTGDRGPGRASVGGEAAGTARELCPALTKLSFSHPTRCHPCSPNFLPSLSTHHLPSALHPPPCAPTHHQLVLLWSPLRAHPPFISPSRRRAGPPSPRTRGDLRCRDPLTQAAPLWAWHGVKRGASTRPLAMAPRDPPGSRVPAIPEPPAPGLAATASKLPPQRPRCRAVPCRPTPPGSPSAPWLQRLARSVAH